MKRLMCMYVAAICAAVAMALPKAEWLPADVDVTMAFIVPQIENPELKQAWDEAFKGVDPNFDLALAKRDPEAFKQQDPEAYAVLKALVGLSEDGKRLSLVSVSMGMTLPRTAAGDSGFKAVILWENPALDAQAFDAAIRALVAKKAQETGKDLSVVPMGEWMDAGALQAGGEIKLRGCYRPCAQGLMMILAQDEAEAEAWLAGAKLTAAAPVAAPFAAVKEPCDWALVVADVAGLLTRYVPESADRKQVELQMPWLPKTHRLMLSSSLSGVSVVGRLSAMTDSAEMAERAQNTIEMYRLMAAQMILPALFKKPDAAVVRWLMKQVSVEAADTEVRMRMVFEPKMMATFVKEFEELKARKEQEAEARRRKLFEHEVRESKDSEKMSAEEAKQILDGIEAK
ncbi:MAG: hypothetical protein ACI4RT_01035 [Candidatus Spyradenecus sp.]